MAETKILETTEIVVDEKLYPRIKPDYDMVVRYSKAMKKGDTQSVCIT